MGSKEYFPLFETKEAKTKILYRLFAFSVFVAICLVLIYRLNYIPSEDENGRWIWIGLLGSELWFTLYWVFTQAVRWNPTYRFTFKDRLSDRYEHELPRVDVFVCTANPELEPPIMVINTVLSVMAYDYPSEKLSVYLSDDGGSILTFYALLEASEFGRKWIPYCKKFNVEPRSPAAYFDAVKSHYQFSQINEEFRVIKKLYEEMKDRIETATKVGRIPEEIESKHRGFSNWNSYPSRQDHDTILQILVDGKDPNAIDIDGCALPTLVYLAREKRPQHPHNFKAGAMNALIRVSSKISNGDIILNVDCDMYSNSSTAIRDALCFFMDEMKSHGIAFVQFPQNYFNITKNDVYGSELKVPHNVELHGMDGFGGCMYIGTGCFHRRDVLCGRKFTKDSIFEWSRNDISNKQQSVHDLEEEAKPLASCSYEQNTKWGKEMGLKYGVPVEDIITGLSIHSRGWKSVYFNPDRKAFLGLAPTTLPQALLQHKRWSEGHLQIFFSKHGPVFAYGKINLGLQLGYCCYNLWGFNCLATLFYSIFPSLCLLKSTPLFPQVSSPWFLPFLYVISAKYIYSLIEYLHVGGTVLGWWNDQRIWLYRRTSSYLFGFIETILKILGFTDSAFVITAKVSDEDVSERYEKEIMEFGVSSPMFTILATLAMLNLACFVGVVKNVILHGNSLQFYERMALQIVLCGALILINWPLYQGLFFRIDKGKLPGSLAVKSFVLALIICTSFISL